MLITNPELLSRFHDDATSSFTHGPATGGFCTTVTGHAAISSTAVAVLGAAGARVDMWSVDAQRSAGGGVVVVVTGGVVGGAGGPTPRPFVQSFFLAPQEKGFFVLNDVFRYLPTTSVGAGKPVLTARLGAPAAATANGVPAEAPAPAAPAAPAAAVPKPAAPAAAAPAAAPAAADPSPSPAPAVDPSKPLTYADRLKLGASKAAAGAKPPVVTGGAPPPAPPPRQTAAAAAMAAAAGDTAPTPSLAAAAPTEPSLVADEPVGSVILARDLPADATAEAVTAAFAPFGAVKRVAIKPSRGTAPPHAFIEFIDIDAAGKALASPPAVDGVTLSCQERAPLFIRGAGRGGGRGGGRVGPARGRGEGGRGRGEGRGRGRGEAAARGRGRA